MTSNYQGGTTGAQGCTTGAATLRVLCISCIGTDHPGLPGRKNLDPALVRVLVASLAASPAPPSPVHVWEDPDNPNRYWVVSGRMRLAALEELGVGLVTAVVHQVDEETAALLALRELTDPGRPGSAWDMAHGHQVVYDLLKPSSGRDYARMIGKPHSAVADYLRIANAYPREDTETTLRSRNIDPLLLSNLNKRELLSSARVDEQEPGRVQALVEAAQSRDEPDERPASLSSKNVGPTRPLSERVIEMVGRLPWTPLASAWAAAILAILTILMGLTL